MVLIVIMKNEHEENIQRNYASKDCLQWPNPVL